MSTIGNGEATSPLLRALATAQDRAKAVQKDSQNAHFKYNYASTESILSAVKEALSGTGLSVRPKSHRVRKEGDLVVVSRVLVLAHESGEEREVEGDWPVVTLQGTGRDGKPVERPLDRALAGALTSSLGYLLRDIFMLPRLDEEDMDHSSRDAAPAAPSVWQVARDEATKLAKAAMERGVDKVDIVAAIRRASGDAGVISDAGLWQKEPAPTGIDAIIEVLHRIVGTAAGNMLSNSAAPAPAATPTTAPAGAPAGAPPGEAAQPASREGLDRLGLAMAQAIQVFGTSKAAIIALIRGWAGRAEVVGDDGRFGVVSRGDYAAIVRGFKSWEAEQREAARLRPAQGSQAPRPGPAPGTSTLGEDVDAAERAMKEWEAAGGAGGEQFPVGGPV